MNERIKLLATKWANQRSEFNGHMIYTFADNSLEKFAELIVRECISVVENLSPGYDDYRNQIEDAFRRDCVEQLKSHFDLS